MLTDEPGCHVYLFTEEKRQDVNIYEPRGEHASDYQYRLWKFHRWELLYIIASGKAILANLSRSEVKEMVN